MHVQEAAQARAQEEACLLAEADCLAAEKTEAAPEVGALAELLTDADRLVLEDAAAG